MTGRIRLARQTRVEACQALLEIEPLLVGRDADLLDEVKRAAAPPATRRAFLPLLVVLQSLATTSLYLRLRYLL